MKIAARAIVTPERRHVQQIVFPNAEAAQAAAERIAKGDERSSTSPRSASSPKRTSISARVTKAAMIDRAVADAAFALKEGEVSAPVKGRFGTVLVQVLKIEPEQVRAVRAKSRDELKQRARDRARQGRDSRRLRQDRGRALDGKPLAEAAAKLKLAARTIEAIDRSGRDPDGRAGDRLPDAQRLLPRRSAPTSASRTIRCKFQDGYIWFDVAGITPSARPPARRGQGAGRDALARRQEIANAPATPRRPKCSTSSRPARRSPMSRPPTGSEDRDPRPASSAATRRRRFRPRTVDAVFRTAKDGSGTAEARGSPASRSCSASPTSRCRHVDVDSEEAKRIREALNRGLTEDVFGEYLGCLQRRSA